MNIQLEVSTIRSLAALLRDDDTYDSLILRLISQAEPPEASLAISAQPDRVGFVKWLGKGVEPAVGTKIYANYKRRNWEAVLGHAGVELEGQVFDSVSAAAIHIVEKYGTAANANRNGWRFWKMTNPHTGALLPLEEFRVKSK